MISLYEIAIKKNIGKLDTVHTIETFSNEIKKVGMQLIPIEIIHLCELRFKIQVKAGQQQPI
jgi:PIN domain nuclease of toxin-antitoxin system